MISVRIRYENNLTNKNSMAKFLFTLCKAYENTLYFYLKLECTINTFDKKMHTVITITNNTIPVNINYMRHNKVWYLHINIDDIFVSSSTFFNI